MVNTSESAGVGPVRFDRAVVAVNVCVILGKMAGTQGIAENEEEAEPLKRGLSMPSQLLQPAQGTASLKLPVSTCTSKVWGGVPSWTETVYSPEGEKMPLWRGRVAGEQARSTRRRIASCLHSIIIIADEWSELNRAQNTK